uniref:60S ribosomal protein L22-3 n=1 Tax=Solanum tuberosum TaxID=4113 RepID=M1D4J5_SOLTU
MSIYFGADYVCPINESSSCDVKLLLCILLLPLQNQKNSVKSSEIRHSRLVNNSLTYNLYFYFSGISSTLSKST